MTAQTKLGGVSRDALLRVWFLFYVWALLSCFFNPRPHWGWFAWLFGAALTCWLLYRRSALAGIVGYLVSGSAVVATLPVALWLWGLAPFLSYNFYDNWDEFLRNVAWLQFPGSYFVFSLRLFQTALAFVPAVVFGLHIASRHRLLRAFEDSVAERRHGRVIAPGAYYLVIPR